jgi:ribosome-associated toxin RatA of RatAB toxin-antitoxin module
MKMLRGPWFFRKFAGTWRFTPCEGGTEVVFHYAFQTRWRWLSRLFDPLIRWIFRRDVRARLRGLKRGAEEQGLLPVHVASYRDLR